MYFIFYIIVFILGTVVGSFLNCLIYRLEKNKGFVRGRSFCPKCKHNLAWYDLIPVVSFIALRGKCRYCQQKISWQYPAVEIAAGVLFVLLVMRSFAPPLAGLRMTAELSILNFPAFAKASAGNQFLILNFKTAFQIVYFWAISSLLLVIFVYDLKHYLIPDKALFPAIGAVGAYRLCEAFQLRSFSQLKIALLAACLAALFFFGIWAVSRGRWLGFGDVKLAFLLGLFLGWPNILVGLFSGFLLGAIIGIGLILLKKKTIKSQVPFGPFLIGGAFLALFWGKALINWYVNLFLF